MSLLDDLEQQAQQRKAGVDDAKQRKAVREEFFKTHMEPRMAALAEYLQKLIANLKVLQPRTPRHYTLPGYGDVVAYSDHDYELKLTTRPDLREIVLTFGCSVAQDECALIEMEGIKVKALAGTFQRHHLGGALLEPKKDAAGEIVSAKFRARGRIPLSATFDADADSTAVKMSFVNFEAFGSARKTISIGQLDEAFFDDIGRYVTHEDNHLFREALPDDYRAQLRTAIERDKVKRRWEFKILGRRRAEIAALKAQHGEGPSLLGRLRKRTDKES